MILDGWGYSPDRENNAIALAKTPVLDELLVKYPNGLLKASGQDVGLPEGVMGNSEVGHTNIGAGRIVYQDLTRIDRSIASGEFFQNPVLLQAFETAAAQGGKVHLLGLLSDGGVHSHIRHLEALIDLASRRKVQRLVVHAIMDGRDTAPMVGDTYLQQLDGYFQKYGVGELGSLAGRYYTMDRDTRWDRVEKGWQALVGGQPLSRVSPREYLKESHEHGTGDEFTLPVCFKENATIADHDTVIFFNFRADRARQITRALTSADFHEFASAKPLKLASFVCMTEYDANFKLPVAFPAPELSNTLGEVISKAGLRQLRIAETEKYAHVTFFLNGGREVKFDNEDRDLIESPRDIATYDQKPEMSARAVTDKLLAELDRNVYDLVVINFANCDMVGHTGVLQATIQAVEVVDECLGRLVTKVLDMDGQIFLTADHGNAETMVDDQGRPMTAHTSNPVRYLVISRRWGLADIATSDGRLADVMPTLLFMMGLPVPAEITGQNLLSPTSAPAGTAPSGGTGRSAV
jgi:2,3-bisphosphoglycerate-independent phosphoglycerate mutase